MLFLQMCFSGNEDASACLNISIGNVVRTTGFEDELVSIGQIVSRCSFDVDSNYCPKRNYSKPKQTQPAMLMAGLGAVPSKIRF